MAQKTDGLHAVLSAPGTYDLLQSILGASRARRRMVSDHIRPGPGSIILDIGCGTGELLPYLPSGIDYHGFDLSQRYIDAACQRERGTFECMDIADYRPNGGASADVVLSIGVLHHLDDDVAAGLLKTAFDCLKPGGRFISMDGTLVDGQSRIARAIVLRDRSQNIRTPESYARLAHLAFDDVKFTVQADLLYVPYTHCILECTRH